MFLAEEEETVILILYHSEKFKKEKPKTKNCAKEQASQESHFNPYVPEGVPGYPFRFYYEKLKLLY